MDVTRRPSGKWIVDFGWELNESEAALYEEPFRHVQEHVHPMRQRTRREEYRAYWWRHLRPRPNMWEALDGMSRYIATPRVAKHRLFVWLDARICPDCQLIVITREDDTTFGILHSRFHTAWSLRLGTSGLARATTRDTRQLPRSRVSPSPKGCRPDVPARQQGYRPMRRFHLRSSTSARPVARPLAQPARMGRVGQRTVPRLPSTSGAAKRSRIRATQETYPNQPLQPPPSVARRCTPCPRRGSSSGLRVAREHLDRRRLARTGVAKPMWLRELIELQRSVPRFQERVRGSVSRFRLEDGERDSETPVAAFPPSGFNGGQPRRAVCVERSRQPNQSRDKLERE